MTATQWKAKVRSILTTRNLKYKLLKSNLFYVRGDFPAKSTVRAKSSLHNFHCETFKADFMYIKYMFTVSGQNTQQEDEISGKLVVNIWKNGIVSIVKYMKKSWKIQNNKKTINFEFYRRFRLRWRYLPAFDADLIMMSKLLHVLLVVDYRMIFCYIVVILRASNYCFWSIC